MVISAFGVRGEVRIRPFTSQPENIARYGEIFDESGERRFSVEGFRVKDGTVLARLSGIGTRNAAEALAGMHLYVSRQSLPQTEEDEWYYAELIGLEAYGDDGALWGRVKAVWDFGAGDVLELEHMEDKKQSLLIPFTRENVAGVSVPDARITLTETARRFEWQRS